MAVARRRKLVFDLTKEQYLELRRKPCHYCGYPLNPTGVNLDRKDCSKGYTLDNVVPCCQACNLARGSIFSSEEFLRIGEVIRQIKNERVARGLSPDLYEGCRGWGRPKKYNREPAG